MAQIRMQRAEALLAQGGLVLSVAQAVGYESPSKFTAAFKRVFAESPSAYRDRMKANGGAPGRAGVVQTRCSRAI
jgi:AraC-like DNA-binding protein